MMRFYIVIRIGRWMLTNEGVFELREHRAVKSSTTQWQAWDCLYSFK